MTQYATTQQLKNTENQLTRALETQIKKTEDKLMNAITDISKAIGIFANQVYAKFDEIDKRFDRMDERFDRIEERLDRIEERLEALEYKTYNLEEKVSRIDKTVQKLDQDDAAFATSICDLHNADKLMQTRLYVLERARA